MPLSLNFPSADAPATASPIPGAPSISGQPTGALDSAAGSSGATFDNCLAAQADPSAPASSMRGQPAPQNAAALKAKKDNSKDAGASADKSASTASSSSSSDQATSLLGGVSTQQLPPPPAPNSPTTSATEDSSGLGTETASAEVANAQTSTSSSTLSKKQSRYFAALNPAVQNAYAAQSSNAASVDASSGSSSTDATAKSAKGTPNAVAKKALRSSASDSAAANATAPETTSATSSSVQDSISQLLASGAPLIDYSFGSDGKLVPSLPAAVNAPATAQSSKAQLAMGASSNPNQRAAKTSQATADFASLGDLNASLASQGGASDVSVDADAATPSPAAGDASLPPSVPTQNAPLPSSAPDSVVSSSLQTAQTGLAKSGDRANDGTNVALNPTASAAVSEAIVSNTPGATLTPSLKAFNRTGNSTGAKIAVGGTRAAGAGTSGVKSSNSNSKNEFENVDNEDVSKSGEEVGTRSAKRVFSMPNDNPSSSAGARSSDPFAALAAASLTSDNTSRTAETVSPTPSDVTSHAAQTVREIRDIADGLWAVERNSVEVRFNFSDTDKLSVRVELRDGTVQTTFRTDSPDLRDHLASAWQAQQAGAASESRPYRIAEPVFGSGQSQSSSDQAQDYSFNGSSSRQQQRSSDQGDSSPSSSAFSFARSASSTTTAPVTPRLLRPETTLHLNAFA